VAPKAAPSFIGLSAASPASSYAKKMNRAQDTAHEKILRALLWRRGLRFRKNVASLPGRPDVVFTRRKIAIFCDGDFWHGRDWRKLSAKLSTGTNPSYWLVKIKTNRERDHRTDTLLQEAGWTVLRYWETDIHRDPGRVALEIADIVRSKSVNSKTHTERASDCQRATAVGDASTAIRRASIRSTAKTAASGFGSSAQNKI